jgi:NADH dehydrogenase FAD-containing subunit
MGPGMLGRTYAPDDIRFFTKHVVQKQGGTFILGKAVRVDPKEKKLILESGETVPYDVLSFNVGSFVPENSIMGSASDVFTVKPIEKLIEAQARILELASRKKITIDIVGGGPSAAEIAGNV